MGLNSDRGLNSDKYGILNSRMQSLNHYRQTHYIKSQYIRDQFVNPSTTTRSIRLSRRNQLITPHFGALALKYDVITSLRSICSAYYALVLALDQSDAAVQANYSAELKCQQTPRVLRRNDIK